MLTVTFVIAALISQSPPLKGRPDCLLFIGYLIRVVPYKHWIENASRKQTIFCSKPLGVTAWIFLGK
jgi:hypothetical protein